VSISTTPVFLRVSALGNHDFITERPLLGRKPPIVRTVFGPLADGGDGPLPAKSLTASNRIGRSRFNPPYWSKGLLSQAAVEHLHFPRHIRLVRAKYIVPRVRPPQNVGAGYRCHEFL
jgi:hypothetical protein